MGLKPIREDRPIRQEGSPKLNGQTYVTGWRISSSLFIPVLPTISRKKLERR
jgi:hypothetical protein